MGPPKAAFRQTIPLKHPKFNGTRNPWLGGKTLGRTGHP